MLLRRWERDVEGVESNNRGHEQEPPRAAAPLHHAPETPREGSAQEHVSGNDLLHRTKPERLQSLL